MKWKTLFTSFAFASLMLLSAAEQANACSCIRSPSPCAAFSDASAVFVGTVISFSTLSSEHSDGSRKYQFIEKVARFSIEQAYKGVSGAEVEVFTGQGDSDCGYGFEQGKRYVVYAYRGSESDRLATGICSRTALASKANEDLQFLNGLVKARSGGRIYGQVTQYIGDRQYEGTRAVRNLSGVTVTIEGQGYRLEVITDGKGKYEITGVQPGEYEISAQLPEQFGVIGPEGMPDDKHGSYKSSKVKVGDKGCAKADLAVFFDGRISGVVRDSENRPIPEMSIELIKFETLGDSHINPKYFTAETDEEGRYEFRMVQPGRYVVGINIASLPDERYSDTRTFYPGVSDLSKAQVIEIGEGTKLKGFDLNVPSRLKEGEVKGTFFHGQNRVFKVYKAASIAETVVRKP
jgi:hypothetical protein